MHGGVNSNQVKYDFSVNLSPFGMPKEIKHAIAIGIDDYEKYPDSTCDELCDAISKYYKVPQNWVCCGNGSNELIYSVIRALMPKKCLLIEPSFTEYKKALQSVGSKTESFLLREYANFSLTTECIDVITEKIKDCEMVIIANPMNPNGIILNEDLICLIADKCAVYGKFLVIDEAFIEFTTEKSFINQLYKYKNVVVIKSFTKIFAMAGVRLGFVCAGNNILIEKIRQVIPTWSVSGIAQNAGKAAINLLNSDKNYLSNIREYVAVQREYLNKELDALGYKTYPSYSNYILFYSNDNKLEEKLLLQGFAIRKCDDYVGLSGNYYRIGILNEEANRNLIKALRSSTIGTNL